MDPQGQNDLYSRLKRALQGATPHEVMGLECNSNRSYDPYTHYTGPWCHEITVKIRLCCDMYLILQARQNPNVFHSALQTHVAYIAFPDAPDECHRAVTQVVAMANPMDMSHSVILQFQATNLEEFCTMMEHVSRSRYEREFSSQVERVLSDGREHF